MNFPAVAGQRAHGFNLPANSPLNLTLAHQQGRAGTPLHAAVAEQRLLVHHDGAHGVTRPTCPNVAKNCYRIGFVRLETKRTNFAKCTVPLKAFEIGGPDRI